MVQICPSPEYSESPAQVTQWSSLEREERGERCITWPLLALKESLLSPNSGHDSLLLTPLRRLPDLE